MKIKGIVFKKNSNPDVNGNIFPEDLKIEIPKKVKVTNQYSKNLEDYLGEADLTLKNGVLIGNIKLIKESPLRHPAIAGQVLERDGNIIKSIRITEIGLFPEGCGDRDLKPLKET